MVLSSASSIHCQTVVLRYGILMKLNRISLLALRWCGERNLDADVRFNFIREKWGYMLVQDWKVVMDYHFTRINF